MNLESGFTSSASTVLSIYRVVDEGSWNFDGLLLITHELSCGELTNQASLNTVAFLGPNSRFFLWLLL
ncbi:hypothetical protein LINGRAHAP2_LOCUS14589 [Linum grandiflorum]